MEIVTHLKGENDQLRAQNEQMRAATVAAQEEAGSYRGCAAYYKEKHDEIAEKLNEARAALAGALAGASGDDPQQSHERVSSQPPSQARQQGQREEQQQSQGQREEQQRSQGRLRRQPQRGGEHKLPQQVQQQPQHLRGSQQEQERQQGEDEDEGEAGSSGDDSAPDAETSYGGEKWDTPRSRRQLTFEQDSPRSSSGAAFAAPPVVGTIDYVDVTLSDGRRVRAVAGTGGKGHLQLDIFAGTGTVHMCRTDRKGQEYDGTKYETYLSSGEVPWSYASGEAVLSGLRSFLDPKWKASNKDIRRAVKSATLACSGLQGTTLWLQMQGVSGSNGPRLFNRKCEAQGTNVLSYSPEDTICEGGELLATRFALCHHFTPTEAQQLSKALVDAQKRCRSKTLGGVPLPEGEAAATSSKCILLFPFVVVLDVQRKGRITEYTKKLVGSRKLRAVRRHVLLDLSDGTAELVVEQEGGSEVPVPDQPANMPWDQLWQKRTTEEVAEVAAGAKLCEKLWRPYNPMASLKA